MAVVTGGASGIGAAIAEELGRRGAYVVTVDPGVGLDGSPQGGGTSRTTAQRIVDAGGRARASDASVTDAPAIEALCAELVTEHGTLDTVVNVAGIVRATGFASGDEADWRAVLEVHVDGYLNVLRAALPIMAAAGYGRVLGVTSGSGWRPADAGAYGCAKRTVAALTWQVGRLTPPGVTVNALSPIAATRMVTASRQRRPQTDDRTADARAGGISLATDVPPPEHLGPVGSDLAGEAFGWCRGEVVFSNGSEISLVSPPRLLEVAWTTGSETLPARLDALGPAVLAAAEEGQATTGGGNPRLLRIPVPPPARGAPRRCLVVTDRPAWARAMTASLAARGVECTGAQVPSDPTDPARGFAAAGARIAATGSEGAPIDAVVVALTGAHDDASADRPAWRQVLDGHEGIVDRITADAAWVRAVADHSAASGRAVRIVSLVDASSAGGRSRAQAATQLSRAAHLATERVDAFVVGIEAATDVALGPAADLAAYLASGINVAPLSGAEMVVGAGWFGVRRHPHPVATISFDGPDVPGWLDPVLREIVVGESARPGRDDR